MSNFTFFRRVRLSRVIGFPCLEIPRVTDPFLNTTGLLLARLIDLVAK